MASILQTLFDGPETIKSGPYKGMTEFEKDEMIDRKVRETKARKQKDKDLETAVNEYMGSLKDAPDHELYKNWNIRNRKPGQVLPGDYKSMLPQGGRGMSEGQLRVARGKMGLEETYPARDERYEDLMKRNRESMRQPTQNPQMISSPEKGPAPAPEKKPSTKQITQQSQKVNQQINKSGVREQGKQAVAQAKEQMGRYYVDPQTGYALNLDKLDKAINRKKSMEVAAMLPASSRALFLYQQGVIDKEDIPPKTAAERKQEALLDLQLANAAIKLEKEKNNDPNRTEMMGLMKQAIASKNPYLMGVLAEGLELKDENGKPLDILKMQKAVNQSLTKGQDKDYKDFIDSKEKFAEAMLDPDEPPNEVTGEPGKPGKRTLALNGAGILSWEQFSKLPDEGRTQYLQQIGAGKQGAIGQRFPLQAPTEVNYRNWATKTGEFLYMSNLYKDRYMQLERKHQVIVEDKNDSNKLDTGQTTVTTTKTKTPKTAEEPKAKKEETTNWQGDFVNVSGNATNILNQAKAQGYSGGTVKEFISDLNKATGGNYTAKNLPAKMPKFWGKDDKKEKKEESARSIRTDDTMGLLKAGVQGAANVSDTVFIEPFRATGRYIDRLVEEGQGSSNPRRARARRQQ